MRAILRLATPPVLFLAMAVIAVVLAAGLLWLQGRTAPGGQRDCPPATNLSPVPSWTPGSAAGGQPFHGLSGSPKSSPTPPLVPAVSGGHIRVTFANNRSTVTVPVGTVIDVELDSEPWSLPVSSGPQMLPLISSSLSCDGSVRASFGVQGSGWIEADVHMPSNVGAPDIVFRVNVVASP